MNRPRSRKSAAFTLLMGLIFLWQPIFMHYYGLMEADFLTSGVSFENPDLEIPLAGKAL